VQIGPVNAGAGEAWGIVVAGTVDLGTAMVGVVCCVGSVTVMAGIGLSV
jgi:hypothetical protein